MMWKIIGAIFCIILLFTVGIQVIPDGVHDWRTDEEVQSEIVATALGVTTADVILDDTLFSNKTSEVISITSSIAETPVATGYTSGTRTLEISALDADTSRTLTIRYYSDVDDSTTQALGPFFTIIIFLLIIGAIVWGLFGKGRR